MAGITGTVVIITANLVPRPLEPAHSALVTERKPARITRRVGNLPSNGCVYERRSTLQVAVEIVPSKDARGVGIGRIVVGTAQVKLSYQRARITSVSQDFRRRDFIR